MNDVLVWLGILDAPRNWLDGRASSVILGLVYGYVPFMILPLYAFLDRIDRSLLEAARDLGASPFQAFRLVTLPLSMPAILAGIVIIALPMFGDYYTPDLLSGLAADEHHRQPDQPLHPRRPADPGRRRARRRADALPLRPHGLLPRTRRPAPQRRLGADAERGSATWLANPWGKPRFLVLFTALYLVWSIVPILIAIRFSFNEGRSRSTAQGWSLRWYSGDPDLSVLPRPRPQLRARSRACGSPRSRSSSRCRSGVALADRLTRWRGRGAGTSRGISLATARHAGDRDGGRALPRLRAPADVHPARHDGAGDRPHHVLARRSSSSSSAGRLLAIGPEYEEAARDLGASRSAGAAARAAADARSRDRRERDHRVRDLDGRLRDQRVPLVGHVDGHRAGADLLDRPHRADAGAERARDADARAHDRRRRRRASCSGGAFARLAARPARRSASSRRSTPSRFARSELSRRGCLARANRALHVHVPEAGDVRARPVDRTDRAAQVRRRSA